MAQLTDRQQRWRSRIESGLRVAAPFLDLLLVAGDGLTKLVVRDDARDADTIASGRDDKRRAITDGRV